MRLKDNICPRCGEKGYGLFVKWVLNAAKTRYEPYYYFAHRVKDEYGYAKLKWCYIKLAKVKEILKETSKEATNEAINEGNEDDK